jgi:DNA-binding transcriptional regulator LsrR (DeoR family)
MGIQKNDRLVLRICRLYYEENFSQKDISQRLSVSRSQISRMLAYARETGIVTIKINNPYAEEDALEAALTAKYGLRFAEVVNTWTIQGSGVPESIGRRGGLRLTQYLSTCKTIGIISGKSVFSAVDNVIPIHNPNLTLVSLVGGMGCIGARWHANYMSQHLAELTGGRAWLLNTPLFMRNEEARRALENEEGIRQVFEYACSCDAVFAGIGQINAGATLVESGILNPEDLVFLKQAGTAAAVGSIFFDRLGTVLDNEYTRRFIGIGADILRRCPNVVAIAFGEEKITAIDAALRSRLIHELVTDTETARGLLNTGKEG